METIRYFAGLDLGQASDYTALVVVEQQQQPPSGWGNTKHEPARYAVRHLERYPLGTAYTEIVQRVQTLRQQLVAQHQTDIIVDGSGVGRAVVDLFQTQMDGYITPVQITGGHTTSRAPDGYLHVPKRDLIGSVQVLLQQKRLQFAGTLPGVAVLLSELQNYRVKITEHANETFNAREGTHDDLVLALALACWYAESPHSTLQVFL